MSSHRYDDLVALIRERQPACGTTTVVAVDGPSGSGKTSLVGGLADAASARVLHLEDLYPGWHGLDATPPIVHGILGAIAVGNVGAAARWDWVDDRPGPLLHVPPAPLLILDGVGSGAAMLRPFLSLLIWVEAPADVRKERALARDGGVYAPYWDVWAAQEAAHFAAEETRRHADVVVHTGA
ncbi:4-amino-4-deoxy-L-arabinose transferase [Aeromicrobium ginsengisoli]|uniref:4-amino-4-deoxy-L-arabinose transferase n=1 Tax=Aeromicrobium ginsengisoli TaxID=363867 RepID=A0A5M4FJA1_9ACTN|nr:4-amino-4-deoxy-L-arabinose transferase [Aeromicrobium ginsengisoli]KAA1400038.1 4-amino-4-deoxy-L-arabinose transferase [Aeromicrobium ginsengisoli]